jgi:hypothetical protein
MILSKKTSPGQWIGDMETSDKSQLFLKLLRTPQGRALIAESVTLPLRYRVSNTNLFLRVFKSQEILEDVPEEGLEVGARYSQSIDKVRENPDKERDRILLRLGQGIRPLLDEQFQAKILQWAKPGPLLPAGERGFLLMDALAYAALLKKVDLDRACQRDGIVYGLMGEVEGSKVIVSKALPPGLVFSTGKSGETGSYTEVLTVSPCEDLWDEGRYSVLASLAARVRVAPGAQFRATLVEDL